MNERNWPPVPGDFEVKDLSSSVAVCTLGKKIEVAADYAIIGTCKTENIGIERMIVNVVSNSSIRFFILSGPEVPGHKTGSSLTSLYENGVDPETRKIIEAPGAIPYIENIPTDAIERFRKQVTFVNMMNTSDPSAIAEKVAELNSENPGEFDEEPLWIDFKSSSGRARKTGISADILVLPEVNVTLDYSTSLILQQIAGAIISTHPTQVGVEITEQDGGTISIGKEI